MSSRFVRRCATVAVVALAPLAAALPASAHNAGHFVLPGGQCLNVGSFKDAPLIGPEGSKVELDLIPETPNPPYDEYGASFAAFQGATPILPGGCPS